MNKVELHPFKRSVAVDRHQNTATMEAIQIKSEYHYAHPGQVVEEVSER